jgi:putative transposase
MTNHIHLIARPSAPESLAKSLGRTHLHYTQYVNRLHTRSGHLWRNRFFSCPLGREHFWQALRYIEQNPVRAAIVRRPWQYQWSSADAHLRRHDATGLLNLPYWKRISAQVDWRQALEKVQPKDMIDRIRLSTNTGRPLAGDSFISKLEKVLNKRLRPLPIGRPKKNRAQLRMAVP